MDELIRRAADIVTQSDGILIGAGAGMGVDSGLPDFRGNEGFWRAYPPMKRLGLSFYDLANPVWFKEDPQRAWGFYGHRRNLYRRSSTHAGFDILRKWVSEKINGGFVFTSNVDGHFQKAGFDDSKIIECHGSIQHSQCVEPCSNEIWAAGHQEIEVDVETFRANGQLPDCQRCKRIARPNILMFGDGNWLEQRTYQQYRRFELWLAEMAGKRLAVIEIGAGTAIPTVRRQCENIARQFGVDLIRINPRESEGRNAISIGLGALEALRQINEQRTI